MPILTLLIKWMIICCALSFSTNSLLDCEFAKHYAEFDLFQNNDTQHEFFMNASYWEGKFATQGDGLNYNSALTYDGTAIDYQTGLPQQSYLREFSAPSKESMHISLLALGLNGNPYALNFFSSGMEEVQWNDTVQNYILSQLTKKMTSYENFYKSNLGFGGYLPWFSVNDTGLWRMDANTASVNGQDNGELIWALVAAYKSLNDSGNLDLAERYKNYVNIMSKNMEIMFLKKNSTFAGLRCSAAFNATTTPPVATNYWSTDNCYLDDPYGNELLWVYYDLFVAPSDNFTRQQILQRKLAKIVSVNLPTKWGNITVERGAGYTVHEKWKFMFLPYFDSAILEKVFLNGEKARTHYSYMNNFAGLFSSALNYSVPDLEKTYLPDYVGEGIPQLGTSNTIQIFYTTGSTAALLLHPTSRKYGIAWYINVLLGGKMQGPGGSSESISLDGNYISPIHTWDSKISTVLGFSGGIINIIRDYMKITGTHQRFVQTFNELYTEKFKNIEGGNIEFQVPPMVVPPSGASFSACESNFGVGIKANLLFVVLFTCLILILNKN